jgi:uncharacterized protein (TIGR02145 family)
MKNTPAEPGEFTDTRDGQKYRTVKIGEQVWMAENLNFKIDGSWCYDDDEANGKIYGRLYTWEAAKSACPAGWYLPTHEEWQILVDYAGGYSVAGRKLKSASDWNDYKGQSGNSTDEYGFSALPGGTRYSDGSFGNAGYGGVWWTATELDASLAYYRDMGYLDERVYRGGYLKSYGYAVRCVRD